MIFDTVIANGTLVTAEAARRADLGILDGRIAAAGADLAGRERIDAAGMLVLPGAVDEHVHLQMPVGEFASSDDFYTGTVAAACGGTTAVIDFCEPKAGQPLVEALAARRAEAGGKVAVDYGLHMTLSRADDATLAQIPASIAAGAASFKLYMAYQGLRLDDGELLRALAALGRAGGWVLVHAENHHAIAYLTAQALAEGRTGPENHPRTRPDFMEAEAVGRLLALARITGTPLTVAHLSCAAGLDAVRDARARGQAVGVETCPQYLLLDEAEYRRPGFEAAKFVMSPPLRAERDRAALWAGLAAGEVDTVATDHCPFFLPPKDARPARLFADPRRRAGDRDPPGPALHLRRPGRPPDAPTVGGGVLHRAGPPLWPGPAQGHLDVGADADVVILTRPPGDPGRRGAAPECGLLPLRRLERHRLSRNGLVQGGGNRSRRQVCGPGRPGRIPAHRCAYTGLRLPALTRQASAAHWPGLPPGRSLFPGPPLS